MTAIKTNATDGSIASNAVDGSVPDEGGCECCDGDTACEDCPYYDCETKPATLDVTFASVSLCTCFDVTAGSVRSQKMVVNTGTLNATHTLSHTGGGVYLLGGGSVPIVTGIFEQYDTAGCAGALLNSFAFSLHPRLVLTDDCRIESLTLGYNFAGASNVFNYTLAGPALIMTVGNLNTIYAAGIRGTGGTGTVTFPASDTLENRKTEFPESVTAVVTPITINTTCENDGHPDFSEKFTESTFGGTFCLEWDGFRYSAPTTIGRNRYLDGNDCSGNPDVTTTDVALIYDQTTGQFTISASTFLILDGTMFDGANTGDLCADSPLVYSTNSSDGIGSGGTVTVTPCCS